MLRLWIYVVFLIVVALSCKKENNQITQEISTTGDPVIDGITMKIKENPNDPILWIERAKLYRDREVYDLGIQDAKTALSIDSTKIDYYHLLADLQFDFYQSKDAIKTMKYVVELYPDTVRSLLKLSELQHIVQQYERSVSSINNVIRIDPQNAEAYFMLGMNYRELDDREKAYLAFQRAVELDADLVDGWILLGDMFFEDKKPQAEQYYASAVNAAPSNINALHSYAYYLQNQDKIDQSLEIYTKINQIDPQYEEAYLNTGIIYLSQDSIERALEHFDILAGINPTSSRAYYYRGICKERKGQLSAALTDYQNAVNLDPNFERAKNAIKLLSKNG